MGGTWSWRYEAGQPLETTSLNELKNNIADSFFERRGGKGNKDGKGKKERMAQAIPA